MPMVPDRANAGKRAFSLVEVALALGIVSFAFVTILALVPLGLTSNHDSLEETRAMNLLQAIIADRKAVALSSASPVYKLPVLSPPPAIPANNYPTGTLYLAEDGSSTTDGTAARTAVNSIYRVNYTIYPSTGQGQAILIYFAAIWPAAAASTQPKVEVVATFLP